jgi:glycosyltransferase involved in cell wall biosynthesis
VLLVSRSNLEAARGDKLLPAGKGTVLANGSAVGLDLDDFPPAGFNESAQNEARRGFGISQDAFVLAYVGRPVARKGFDRLLRAWKGTGLFDRGAVLLIAGCSAEECAKAAGEKLRGVIALGYIADLKPLYAASDAVTLPSDHEGFPYSLLEAAAAGRALHGSDIPGIRSAIETNVTGLLFPQGDQEALEATLLRLARDRQLCRDFGAKARARVEQFFRREIVLREMITYYRQDLGIVPQRRSVENSEVPVASTGASKACGY